MLRLRIHDSGSIGSPNWHERERAPVEYLDIILILIRESRHGYEMPLKEHFQCVKCIISFVDPIIYDIEKFSIEY